MTSVCVGSMRCCVQARLLKLSMRMCWIATSCMCTVGEHGDAFEHGSWQCLPCSRPGRACQVWNMLQQGWCSTVFLWTHTPKIGALQQLPHTGSLGCRHWLHSEMWWPRLLRGHSPIAWDDYEKDYSDLPKEVLEQHAVLEGAKEATRQLEASEASIRADLEVSPDGRLSHSRILVTVGSALAPHASSHLALTVCWTCKG